MILEKEFIDLLGKIIAFKSITPDEAGSFDFVTTYLKQLGFNCEFVNSKDTSNLIATLGSSDNILAFAGHVDVVTPGDAASWESDPFTLTIKDDKAYGRGICDMKGGIACFLYALKLFANSGNGNLLQYLNDRDFSIMVILTSDEEGPSTDGTIKIVEKLKKDGIRLKYCILGEPSSRDKPCDIVKTGRRGSLNCYLEITGKQGHVAFDKLCINPIHEAIPVLDDLVNLSFDEDQKLNDKSAATKLQIVNINSGFGVDNVIARDIFIGFNIRFSCLYSYESLQKLIENILDRYPDLKYNISYRLSAKPFQSKLDRLYSVICDSIYEVTNYKPDMLTDGGTSDGRFLIDICDELAEIGLINFKAHQVNEYVSLNDLDTLIRVYYKILVNLFSLAV